MSIAVCAVSIGIRNRRGEQSRTRQASPAASRSKVSVPSRKRFELEVEGRGGPLLAFSLAGKTYGIVGGRIGQRV